MDNVLILHFTHIDNLSSILSYGLNADNFLSTCKYTCSGNNDIKAMRKAKPMPNGTCVGDHVPFYFAPRSPMLYTQKVNNHIDQRKIVYLVTTAEHVLSRGYSCWFSDRNAAISYAKFSQDMTQFDEYVDRQLMKERYWNNTPEFPARQEKRMAEFLVYKQIEAHDLKAYVAYDNTAKLQMEKLGIPNRQIAVKQNWYF